MNDDEYEKIMETSNNLIEKIPTENEMLHIDHLIDFRDTLLTNLINKDKSKWAFCPKCAMPWEDDNNAFGCWNCGFTR